MSIFRYFIIIAAVVYSSNLFAQDKLTEAQEARNKGLEAFKAQELETAVQHLEKSVELCMYLVENEENEEAENLMYETIEKIPGLYLKIGVGYLKGEGKDIKKAIEYLNKAKTSGTDYGDDDSVDQAKKILATVYTRIGGMKMKKQDFEGAIAELDKALKEDNDNSTTYLYKMMAYKGLGNHEQVVLNAKKTMETANTPKEKSDKNKAQSYAFKYFLKLGNDAKTAKKYSEAEERVKTALEFKSGDSQASFLLYNIYHDSKQYDLAIEAGEKAAALSSDDDIKSKIHYEIGKIYQGKGNNEKACEAYQKAKVGAFSQNAIYEIDQVLKCK